MCVDEQTRQQRRRILNYGNKVQDRVAAGCAVAVIQGEGNEMKHIFWGVVLLSLCVTAEAFQPRTGHWFNPAESGTGYNIDIQDGTLIVTLFSYKANGDSEWYLASGPMTNSQHNFTASLDKYRNGQCVSCAYRPAALSGNDGTISFVFGSETAATVTLGGRTTAIQPFNFGFGDPPSGLLGQWIFVFDIISTFADRFDFTIQRAATSTGNGTVWDDPRDAACELQISGTFAGQVFCVDFDSAGKAANTYIFRFGLDETFGGSWVSPTTFNAYSLKGFRVKSKGGFSKAIASLDEKAAMSAVKIAQDAASNGAPVGITEAAALMTFGSSVRAMRDRR